METILMSKSERKRLAVMAQVVSGKLSLRSASELLGLSYRQTKRVLSRYRTEGDRRLVHGLRGNRKLGCHSRKRRILRSKDGCQSALDARLYPMPLRCDTDSHPTYPLSFRLRRLLRSTSKPSPHRSATHRLQRMASQPNPSSTRSGQDVSFWRINSRRSAKAWMHRRKHFSIPKATRR
jgi:Helix-turn-helix domain